MEETQALIDRAQKLGLRLQFDSGFVIVRRRALLDEMASALAEPVIRRLAAQLADVGRELLSRCRNAHGQKLLGRRALAVDLDVVGTIVGSGVDSVNLRYRTDAGEEREREVVGPVHADNVVITSDAPYGAASSGFPVSVDERFHEFIQRAERLGYKFWWDSGFVMASFGTDRKAVAETLRMLDPCQPKKSGLEGYIANMSPWAARMTEIRRLVLARARAAVAGDFIGAQAFAPTIEAISPGYEAKGTVKSLSYGGFVVSTIDPWGREIAVCCRWEDLLLVLTDEPEPAQVFAPSAAPKSEAVSGLGRLRHAFTGD